MSWFWLLLGVNIGFQAGVFMGPNYRRGCARVYRLANRIYGYWWITCPVCGWQVREVIRVHAEIPNQSTSPRASDPLVIDDMMCRDCARMFGADDGHWPWPRLARKYRSEVR